MSRFLRAARPSPSARWFAARNAPRLRRRPVDRRWNPPELLFWLPKGLEVPLRLDTTERRVIGLTAGAHAVTHAVMLALPAAAVLLKAQFGLTNLSYGLIANLSFLGFGLGALPAGLLVDLVGPRKTLRLCLGGLALGSLLVAVSTELWSVVLGTGLIGLAAGLYHPAGLTLISANLTRDGRGMGYHGTAGSLGLASGNLLAAGVLAVVGWPWLFGLYALLATSVLLYQLGGVRRLELQEPHTADKTGVEKARVPFLNVVLALAAMALLGFTYRGMVVFMPLYFSENLPLDGLTPVILGNLATAVVLVGGVAGQLCGGAISERGRPLRSAILLTLAAAGLAVAGRLVGGWGTLAVSVLFSGALFATQPITNAMIGRLMPARHRGKAYGLAGLFNFGVGSLAASVGGAVLELTEPANLFLMLAGSVLAASLALFLLRRRGGDVYAAPRGNPARTPEDLGTSGTEL